MWVTPEVLNIDTVVAHEIGHCFQYQVGCDGMYGFRDENYVGSFWEQCARYVARQIYPAGELDDLKFFTENATVALECYGFNNIFKLNKPTDGLSQVSVNFTGLNNVTYKVLQGWRYGFVSVDADNKLTYGIVGKADNVRLISLFRLGALS